MSEKLCSWVLRLYPSAFRQIHGEEALQLLRDRLRDERGFWAKARFWMDLAADLAGSLLRGGRSASPLVAASDTNVGGGPAFHLLGDDGPRPRAVLCGFVLSLAVFAAMPFWIGHGGSFPSLIAWDSGSSTPGGPQAGVPEPSGSGGVDAPGAPDGGNLSSAERHLVIEKAAVNLRQFYVDSTVGRKMADGLLTHERKGDYARITDRADFAGLLMRQLREMSQDLHLDVIYSQQPLPDQAAGITPEGAARYRETMEQSHCTFEKTDILPHNIGYLKLNSFPDPAVCAATAKAAMASMNRADAVIFDLRDNRGGQPAMVMLLAAYLFDHPEYMYNPREDTTVQNWTKSPVDGSRLANKPIYILTSRRTASGAEHFTYDLKMLKRATVVGETTAGAAHSGVLHELDADFAMAIPEARPINPFSTPDWAVIGVEPDVKVRPTDALQVAQKLAATNLH